MTSWKTRPKSRAALVLPGVVAVLLVLARGAEEADGELSHEASGVLLPELPRDGVEETPGLEPVSGEALPARQARNAFARPRIGKVALPPPGDFLPPRARPVMVGKAERFQIEGNTVFSNDVLEREIADYLNRELSPEDLDEIRQRVTVYYVNEGYVNSGATTTTMEGGVVTVQVVEGRLTTVLAKSRGRLPAWYVERRARVGMDGPLRFGELQHRLQVLQLDPAVKRINAELKPGHLPGEATLLMEVEDNSSWSGGFDFHNQRPPDIGAEQVDFWLSAINPAGFGDSLVFRNGLLSGGFDDPEFAGLDNLFARYRLPVTARDLQVELLGETRDYVVVDKAFRDLDIEGTNWRAGGGLRYPLLRKFDDARSLQDEVWLSLSLERQHSESSLLDLPFSSAPGYVDGELDLTLLRFGQEWTRRGGDSVLAFYSVFSFGLDFLGATDSPVDPNQSFSAWRLDAQYLKRVRDRGDTLVLHGGMQLAADQVPSPEQIPIGGRHTVRGYRENAQVGDNGAFFGVDYRYPLFGEKELGGWRVALVPFVDGGVSWDHDRAPDARWLAGAGLGIVFDYRELARGELFWGTTIDNDGRDGDNLQDHGIHFRFTVTAF